MKLVNTDWHMHSAYSCDEACMTYEDLVASANEAGLVEFGVTDHLHNQTHYTDIERSRKAYDQTLEKHPELKGRFHFGVEASVMSRWEIDRVARGDLAGITKHGFRLGGPAFDEPVILADSEFKERYSVDYVVTGVHWSLYAPLTREDTIRDFFRLWKFAAAWPQTDILAHFGWWFPVQAIENPDMEFTLENPFTQFSKAFSPSMLDEMKAILLEHNTALELNACAMLMSRQYPETFKDEYLGWFGDLQRAGVTLSWGSDCHDGRLISRFYDFTDTLAHYGIDPEKFFRINR